MTETRLFSCQKDPQKLNEFLLKVSKGWQQEEILSELGVKQPTVWRWRKLGFGETPVLDKPASEFIEATLVGDGSIMKGLQYSMTGANQEYISWVKSNIESYGFRMMNIAPYLLLKSHTGYKKDCLHFYARTRKSTILEPLRTRWYPQGKKVMPLDFEWDLTKLSIFIADDGGPETNGSVCYWGEKSDESFELFLEFLRQQSLEFSVWKRHVSSGLQVYIRNTKSLALKPPGNEYKFN